MIIGYVRGQELKVKSPLIAADSIDYLTAQFVFHTKDWDGCRKFTHWKCGETNHTIELENDRIDEEQHLNLTAGTWAVWIHGEVYRDGELIQRITTDEAQIEVKATGSMGGSPFPDAPVSDIERINAELDELREMIEPSGGENSKTTVVDLEQTDNDSVLIPSHTSQEIYDLIRSGHQVTAEVHDDATGESTIFFPVLATAASVMFVNELPGDVSDHDVAYHVVAISGDAAHANDGVYIKEMGGANAGNDGTSGLAPAPVRGQQGHALFGDATWKRAYTADQTDGLIASLSEAIADKLDKSGGEMSGSIIVPAGGSVGIKTKDDVRIFGYGVSGETMHFRVGDPNYPAQLRGSETRPKYNNQKLALYSDIAGAGLLTVETITIDDDNGGETETIPVTGLSLDLTAYSAKAGDGFYINPVIAPSNATNKAVSWQSNATNIATVNDSGYVNCIAEGNAVITCTTVDGGFVATCAVSVAEADSGETEVTLSSISATYNGGDVAVGTAVTDLTGIVVTAFYSDGSTATVTNYTLSGTIAEGSNTVTVSYGGKTTTFTVTGVAESTDGKVLFSTLELTSSLLKADGTVASLGKTHHVSFPYTEGMFVSTGTNGGWNISTYPPVLVLDGGAYSAPPMTKADNAITVDGSIITQYSGTITGYSADAVVYANILTTGSADNTVKNNMDKAGIFYYIPGGEA